MVNFEHVIAGLVISRELTEYENFNCLKIQLQ